MNCFRQVGVPRECLENRRIMGPEQVPQIDLLCLEIGELLQGQVVLQVAPDLCNRVSALLKRAGAGCTTHSRAIETVG
jgi:hypothetical protein